MGYFEHVRTVTVSKKLDRMPYAQAGIVYHDDGSVDLISYETLVIRIDGAGWLECTGTYSQTTRKHIGAFMRELTGGRYDYYTVKECYENSMMFNIRTGEYKAMPAA